MSVSKRFRYFAGVAVSTLHYIGGARVASEDTFEVRSPIVFATLIIVAAAIVLPLVFA